MATNCILQEKKIAFGSFLHERKQLKGKLFYLQNIGEKYFFNNQPNINRILLTNMENIPEEKVVQTELELLRKSILGARLKVFVWEESASNIPDSDDLKLPLNY